MAEKEVSLNYLSDAGIKNPSKSIGKLYYLLNHLRVTPHIKEKNVDEWVSIDTNIIKNIFGNLKYFYSITDKLKADNLIEVKTNATGNETYQKNVSCKKYRLTNIIQDDVWQHVKLSASTCTTTKKILTRYQKNWKPIDYKLYNLLTQFHIEEVKFFDTTTINNFNQHSCKELEYITDAAKRKINEEKENRTLEEVMKHLYRSYKDAYTAMKEGAFRYTVDNYGRRHTNLTNLPKFLREKLYIIKGGKQRKLVTLDVANSQVLLLLTILPKELKSFNKFKELVEEGRFYQFFADKMGIKLTAENKKKIKQQYFTFIYGEHDKAYVWGSKAFKVMKEEFPDIVQWLTAYKKKNGYQKPAQKMQSAESDIIINKVCTSAAKEHLIFHQIYDSILCLEEDACVVKEIMEQAFLSKGLSAKINIEDAETMPSKAVLSHKISTVSSKANTYTQKIILPDGCQPLEYYLQDNEEEMARELFTYQFTIIKNKNDEKQLQPA